MRPQEDMLTTDGGNALARLPLRVIDLGILAVVFLAPLFMGGRGPVGKFVFVSVVCLTVVAWAVAHCRLSNGHWQRSGVEWLLLASIVLVTLQLIPLPQSLLARLSPSISELLPLWSSDNATARLGEWSTVSLTPAATRGALIVLVGYVILFLLVVQRIQSIDDISRILRWVAIGAIAMAVLGLVQFLAGNGKFLWVFDHPSRDTFRSVKGAFHNQNHFAHFLALGVGPLVWAWTKAPAKSLQKHLFGIGMGLVMVAGLLTFSRGGIITIAAASVATVTIFFWKSLLDKRALVMAGIMGAIVAVALLIHGYHPLSTKFSALQKSRSLTEASEGRAALWSALLDGIPQFAWLGSGIGSHRDVYPMFMEEFYDVEFTHGENGFLPLTLEGGIPALLLMLTGICICFWWCYQALTLSVRDGPMDSSRISSCNAAKVERDGQVRFAACAGPIAAGLLASVVHSLVDFVWYISSCMSITVLLAACACRLNQLVQQQSVDSHANGSAPPPDARFRVRIPQPAWVGMAVILLILGMIMVHDRHHSAFGASHWYAYKKIALPTYKHALPEEAVERDLVLQMTEHLKRSLQQDPDNPRTNLRFSAACLRQFELEQRHATNPMALQQIREAALASQFANKEAQDAWLNVAVGENRELLDLALTHCHRALLACPLQGDGYVYLADLSFLESPSAATKDAYIDQAARVRPHSGVVAFAVGQERALVGDLEGALRHWREAFHQDPKIQSLIIEQFSVSIPGKLFLKHFQPEIDALHILQRNYQRNGRTADAQEVARQLVGKLVAQAETVDRDVAATSWFEAQAVYAFLQDTPNALKCAWRAVELEADNFAYRSALGTLLLRNQEYAAAARELQWCLRRKPDDPKLVEKLTAANRGTMQQRSAMAPAISPTRKPR